MKFPRIFGVVVALATTIIMAACAMGGGGRNFQQPPPIPPTGTNYTTCNDQQVPNWLSPVFQNAYKPAVAAMVSHYQSNGSIGYIRIGLGRGGEINLPQGWNQSNSGACFGGYTTNWHYTVGSDANSTWNAYLQSMVNYEGSLESSKKLLVSITPVTGSGTDVDDFIAPIAVSNGMGFGNQGLESSDLTGDCGGDWCSLFSQYPSTTVPRELQTLGQSCPTGTACVSQQSSDTGPLDPLIPYAVLHGSNDLEIYYQDWLIAYDSAYATQVGASSATSLAYKTAIEAVPSGVSMQVLFPPTSQSDPDYQAVQDFLVNNSHVDGFVIAVQWSDFDTGSAPSYSWSISDNAIGLYSGSGKKINLVLQDTTYGGGNVCPSSGPGSNGTVASNCAMPDYMWTVLK